MKNLLLIILLFAVGVTQAQDIRYMTKGKQSVLKVYEASEDMKSATSIEFEVNGIDNSVSIDANYEHDLKNYDLIYAVPKEVISTAYDNNEIITVTWIEEGEKRFIMQMKPYREQMILSWN